MFDEVGIFLRGLVLGVMVAAPVGPVGLLCIRRTLQKGLATGFATGFGAAFADGLFSLIAVLGVTAVIQTIRTYENQIYVLGGLFLFLIAWHTWRDKPKQADTDDVERRYLRKAHVELHGALKSMAVSFVITLTNPATLFGVLAVVAAFGGVGSSTEISALVGGIFCGSSLWWFLLSGGVALFRHRMNEKYIIKINRFTAIILAIIGAGALGTGVWHFLGQ